jgi:hypothetical protein
MLDRPVSEYSVKRKASNFGEARSAADEFRGRVLTNKQTGLEATVSRNNLDKMLSRKAVSKSESPESHSLAVANLDQLFERAIQGWSKPDKDGSESIVAIHRFFTPVVHNGIARLVKMTVKETAQEGMNNPLYTVESVEFDERTPAAWWVHEIAEADGINPREIRSAEAVISMAQEIEKYNSRGNAPLFRLSDALENDTSITKAQRKALGKIGPDSIAESAAERFREVTDRWRLKLRQGIVDRFAALMEIDKQLLDGEITTEENITRSSWVKARMANAASGAVSGLMNAGRIYLDREGVIDVRKDTQGLVYSLHKLGVCSRSREVHGLDCR